MIGTGTDGANAMTGHLQGVVTRLAKESANSKFYRVWCGLHQLDLILKHAYAELWDNEVVDIMKKFIQHLRQQNGLIAKMQATSRWLAMGIVCKWLLSKRIEIFEYFDDTEITVEWAPPDWWWIVVAGISALTELINPVFTKLQAPDLLVSAQSMLLDNLSTEISAAVGVRVRDVDPGEFSVTYGRWFVQYDDMLVFVEDLGMFPRQLLHKADNELHQKVLHSLGHLAIRLVDGIVDIQAERNARNEADSDLPPVLPHQIVKLSTRDFGKTIVDPHLMQLRHFWNIQSIEEIENEHRQLVVAYRMEPALKSAFDGYEHISIASFEDAWGIVEGHFEILRDFCGGIATVFANTASVESDFSILGWEKDKFRLSMTDLSLEGLCTVSNTSCCQF